MRLIPEMLVICIDNKDEPRLVIGKCYTVQLVLTGFNGDTAIHVKEIRGGWDTLYPSSRFRIATTEDIQPNKPSLQHKYDQAYKRVIVGNDGGNDWREV